MASLPSEACDKIPDFIHCFCNDKGIDPNASEISDIFQKTTEYKEKSEVTQRLKIANESILRLQDYVSNLGNGVRPTDQKMQEAISLLSNDFDSLRITESKNVLQDYKIDQYLSDCFNYKTWKDYSPALFNRLPFPDGTLSIIAARPGSGKTASLLNIARDLLTTDPPNTDWNMHSQNDEIIAAKDRNSKRKVLFISFEMKPKDLITRLVLSTAWSIRGSDLGHGYSLEKMEEPYTEYYRSLPLKQYPRDDLSMQQKNISHFFNEAVLGRYIEPAMNSGRFTMYYPEKVDNLNQIMNQVKQVVSPGDLVLIDYVQLLPTPDTFEANRFAASGSYTRLKYVSEMLCATAKDTKAVFIVAAQLNRAGDELRESGDLEQNAHNVIHLLLGDSENSKITMTYEVKKARGSGHLGQSFYLDWQPAYQFMAITSNENKQSKTKKGNNTCMAKGKQSRSEKNHINNWKEA